MNIAAVFATVIREWLQRRKRTGNGGGGGGEEDEEEYNDVGEIEE